MDPIQQCFDYTHKKKLPVKTDYEDERCEKALMELKLRSGSIIAFTSP